MKRTTMLPREALIAAFLTMASSCYGDGDSVIASNYKISDKGVTCLARLTQVSSTLSNIVSCSTDRARHELELACSNSTDLIVGTVLTNRAFQSKTGKWIEGWPREYPVLVIRPVETIGGNAKTNQVFVSDRHSPSVVDVRMFPAGNMRAGKHYVLFLQKNRRVSAWCDRMVFDIVLSVPIKDDGSADSPR